MNDVQKCSIGLLLEDIIMKLTMLIFVYLAVLLGIDKDETNQKS